MSPIELYNELRFKGYFDYNLFSKVLNQKYKPSWEGAHGIHQADEILIQDLQIMSGDIIAEDSFVDSDEDDNEMYGYIQH